MASSCSHAVQRKLGMHWNPLTPKGGREARRRRTAVPCTTDPIGSVTTYPYATWPLDIGYKPNGGYIPGSGGTAVEARRIYDYLFCTPGRKIDNFKLDMRFSND